MGPNHAITAIAGSHGIDRGLEAIDQSARKAAQATRGDVWCGLAVLPCACGGDARELAGGAVACDDCNALAIARVPPRFRTTNPDRHEQVRALGREASANAAADGRSGVVGRNDFCHEDAFRRVGTSPAWVATPVVQKREGGPVPEQRGPSAKDPDGQRGNESQ